MPYDEPDKKVGVCPNSNSQDEEMETTPKQAYAKQESNSKSAQSDYESNK